MKDIKGYEGLYAVTSCGKVWSYRRPCTKGGWMKFQDNGQGYKTVILTKNGKQKSFYVHRLVAETYIPNPDNLSEVDHKDRNRENNCVNNLKWVSYIENGRNKSNSYKRVKCVETGEVFETRAAAARQYNVTKSSINRAVWTGGTCKKMHWIDVKEEC